MTAARFILSLLLTFSVGFGPSTYSLEHSHKHGRPALLQSPNSHENSIAAGFSVRTPNVRALDASTAQQSAVMSIDYLSHAMDEFHNRFPVYDDVSSAGDHFYAFAKIPNDEPALSINGSSTNNPHTGATAIRCALASTSTSNFAGFYFQNGTLSGNERAPQLNFGTVPNAGINLTGATTLTFWARGEVGGEKIDFFMGGVGRNASTGLPEQPYPDSTPAVKIQVTLSTQWQKFSIDLRGKDLSYVLGGFGWVASISGNSDPTRNNPAGVAFYLDDIQYELDAAHLNERLNKPRFIRSFLTGPFQSQPAPVGSFDLVLRNTAFIYDNAVALLAFLADDRDDSLRRARLIGDAFVYTTEHDRTFDNGQLRSAYSAGDISLPPGWNPNNRTGTVPIPGFYDESQQEFFETTEAAIIDTGNNAWAMIALLALYQRTSNTSYLEAARRLGEVIRTFRNDSGMFQGFLGGIENPEATSPKYRAYASSEHNLDVYAAFTTMYRVTGETQWLADAQRAADLVEAMWDSQRNCYLSGTTDPQNRNTKAGQLPVDVQAWSVLALPSALARHPQVLQCAELYHRNTHDGFTGYDFNDDRDGVWFEGTGQMATAYANAARPLDAESIRQELRRAQQTQPFGDSGGIVAASSDGLSTGFDIPITNTPFLYFRRVHVGATAWNVFAQLGFNPYYQSIGNPIDDARFFVRQHYMDFLNRVPDQGGWDYWTSQITQCGTDQTCIHNQRIGVSAAFYIELEFQKTGSVIYRMYRASYGVLQNDPLVANVSYQQFIADRPLINPDPAQIQQSTVNFANTFVQRAQFKTAYPDTMTNTDFVNKLYNIAGLTPYTSERQAQIIAMQSGKTRAQVLLDVIEVPEFKQREFNRAFVLMQYYGYLRRDVDIGGYDFWLGILNNLPPPNNFRNMVCAFLTSSEYQLRFGNTVTRHNSDCSSQ